MQPLGRMDFESLECASEGIHSCELHIFAEIGYAIQAEKAAPIRHL